MRFELRQATIMIVGLLAMAASVSSAEDGVFDSDGVLIRYTDRGQGPAVVLIHGYTGSLESWTQAGTIDQLAGFFRTVAMDCRGHGDSGKPHDANAYGTHMVEDVVRLLDHLDIERAHVIGYSMGAEIALRLVVDHPDRVQSVVIGGSGWSGQQDEQNYQNIANSLAEADSFGPMIRAMNPVGQPEPTAESIAQIDQLLAGQDIDALVCIASAMGEIINLPAAAVSEIQVPVLGIAGEHDAEKANLEKLQGVVRNYQLNILADRDHMNAMADSAFNESIAQFLNNQQ